MITNSSMGTVTVIECTNSLTFANELEKRMLEGQLKIAHIEIQLNNYKAVLIPDMDL